MRMRAKLSVAVSHYEQSDKSPMLGSLAPILNTRIAMMFILSNE